MDQKYDKLSYTTCKIGELRRFLLDREVTTSRTAAGTHKMLKDDLIEHLRELDKSKSFHQFMDLPPEIRLLVYSYPLTYNESRTAHTGILRASKHVHSEAAPVLYDSASFEVSMSEGSARLAVGDHDRGLLRQAILLENGPLRETDKTYKAWMGMRKARHLKLRLLAWRNMLHDDFVQIYEVVRAVSVHMAEAPNLETVVIEVQTEVQMPKGNLLRRALGPIALLQKRVRITFTGVSADNALFLMHEKRKGPTLGARLNEQLDQALRDARLLLPRLDFLAGGLGRPHRNDVLRAIRDLYCNGGWDMEPVERSMVDDACKALKEAMKAGEVFEKALGRP
ncbi:hypothetical protein LTR95_012633 [Oleoguttula sp. CCFEE 5521]